MFTCLYDLPRAVRARRIPDALQFMDLQDAAGWLVATYSGDMIRRLEIAQSMLHWPRLLFLDEPTVGLDPVARDTVWEHIRELRATFHTTIFMTTHDMEESQALRSRFGVLRAGRLMACGSLDELFAHCTGGSAEAADAYGETAHTRHASLRLA